MVVALTGCAEREPPPDAAPGASPIRAAWEARGLRDYRYDFDRHCFCVIEAVQPVTIEVRDGAVARVVSRNTGEEVERSEAIPWYTIDELIRQVEEAEARGEEVQVARHPDGYPTEIEIGSLAADAGVRYEVANLTPLR
jgi:hypothetical protein